MRTIIAGGRDITDSSLIRKAVIKSGFNISEGISGGAKGVDYLGEQYFRYAGIDYVTFHANWQKHGKAAGPLRNMRMAEYASSDPSRKGGLIAIWDGKSRGTKSMIETGRTLGLNVFIYRV